MRAQGAVPALRLPPRPGSGAGRSRSEVAAPRRGFDSRPPRALEPRALLPSGSLSFSARQERSARRGSSRVGAKRRRCRHRCRTFSVSSASQHGSGGRQPRGPQADAFVSTRRRGSHRLSLRPAPGAGRSGRESAQLRQEQLPRLPQRRVPGAGRRKGKGGNGTHRNASPRARQGQVRAFRPPSPLSPRGGSRRAGEGARAAVPRATPRPAPPGVERRGGLAVGWRRRRPRGSAPARGSAERQLREPRRVGAWHVVLSKVAAASAVYWPHGALPVVLRFLFSFVLRTGGSLCLPAPPGWRSASAR